MGYVEQTLSGGERVICSARLHWIIFATPIMLLALGLWLSLGIAVNGSSEIPIVVKFGTAFLLFASVLSALKALVKLRTTEIAATTQRFVVKRGLIRRMVMEINAGQLESVMVQQSLLGRLLDYGTIIAGGTGSGIDPVARVAAPLKLRDALNRISARPPPQDGAARAPPAPAGDAAAVIVGDGKFAFPVVGESHHEAMLERLAGGRTKDGVHIACAVLLLPQPDNPYDPDAVAAFIRGHEVGFLARNVAGEFLQALAAGGYDRAGCEAVIVGGWDRGPADTGFFGVRLNACRPFRLIPAEQWARRQKR